MPVATENSHASGVFSGNQLLIRENKRERDSDLLIKPQNIHSATTFS